jgi:predicted porin
MQKKLMAIAVAGALGAPAVVMAQASTVQIYGRITYEYGIMDQGSGRPSTDYADSPGGSAIGFRGEEKLGGGLSAWFQCESSADVRAMDQTGWCTRNSAVGFKGGFGNIHFGRWDTPMKRALNVGTVGAEETGILGMSFLPFGGSGGADATNSNDGPQRQRWKRREAGLTYYESPRFGGFQVLGAFGTGNWAADTAALDATPNKRPRVISLAGIYQAGPLGIGLAYERHNEFGAHAPVVAADADDRAWGASVAYTFGNIKVGATYLDAKYETGVGTELKKRTATIGVEWVVAGPHSIEAQYGWAGDSKGNSLVGIGGNGGSAASGSDTGGDQFSIAYNYNFSKRTRLKIAYVRVDNDANTRSYRIGNSAALLTNGENVDAFGIHIGHRF